MLNSTSSGISLRPTASISGIICRTVAFIALAMGLLTAPAGAQQLALALASGGVAAGGSVTLNLSLAATTSPASSIQWTLTYTTADIVAVNVTPGSSLGSKQLECASKTGMTTCVAAALSDSPFSSGTLANVTLQTSPTPLTSVIPIGFSTVVAAGADGSAISGAGTGGQITVANSVSLNGLSCTPGSVTTPGSAACVIMLNGAAQSQGFPVMLSSSASSLSVPASVNATAGNTSVSFTAKASQVASSQSVALTAAANGVTKTFTVSLLPPAAPVILISSLACVPATINAASSASCKVELAKAAGQQVKILLKSTSTSLSVPSSVSVAAGALSQTFVAQAAQPGSNVTVTVTAAGPNNSQVFSENILAATIPPPPAAHSIWSSASVPGTITDPDNAAVEVGTKFRSDVAGLITGIRFYKGPQNGGTHVGHLWTKNGTLLATVTFSKESATGWQQANLSKPVLIQANTTYVVSYYAPVSHYSSDEYFFTSAVDSPPLHALQDGTDGPNGLYVYGASAFPNQSWNQSNYWVDVVFVPSK